MSADRFGPAVGAGAVVSVISYWIVSAAVKMSCGTRYFGADYFIDPQGTAVLVAFGFGIAAFAFVSVIFGRTNPDKFEKLVTIGLLSITVLWLGYVLLDDQTCSPEAWKRYAAYLIIPSLICSIVIVGRRWISKHD